MVRVIEASQVREPTYDCSWCFMVEDWSGGRLMCGIESTGRPERNGVGLGEDDSLSRPESDMSCSAKAC